MLIEAVLDNKTNIIAICAQRFNEKLINKNHRSCYDLSLQRKISKNSKPEQANQRNDRYKKFATFISLIFETIDQLSDYLRDPTITEGIPPLVPGKPGTT